MSSILINSWDGRIRMVLHHGTVEPLNDESPSPTVVFTYNVIDVWWWTERQGWFEHKGRAGAKGFLANNP